MAKLIGTAPNQVPTNADLGSLAYMDKDNFDANISELTLGALSREITDTAVDVFVYDTSKDSDGGAWRKRTQHTSWYNEAASATRGSRKEFPAVAVIVCRSDDSLAIYDGDDPDMPMWMVFNPTTGGFLDATDAESAQMLNGVLFMCGGTGSHQIDFISEENTFRSSNTQFNKGDISNRNANNGWVVTASTGLVNINPNDCAMTVLPNAPIDAATGLPVPTIAVATDGGVSVIKDNGTVVDITFSSGGNIPDIEFTYENKLIFNTDFSSAAGGRYVKIYDIPSSDLSEGGYNSTNNALVTYTPSSAVTLNHSPDDTYYHPRDFTPAKDEINIRLAAGYQYTWTGVTKLTGYLDSYRAMAAGITSTYNTGWMNGGIKLATLSDTDDTDVTGSELVTNGTFDTDLTGWTVAGTGATAAVVSGQAVLTRNGSSATLTQYNITTEVGKTYTITVDFVGSTGGAFFYGFFSGGNVATAVTSTTGTYTLTGVAGSTSEYFQVHLYNTTNGTLTLDNISVRLAEEDRSANGNGLQVFGTITKNPVNSGADLVACSGFSTSNYLKQPYNSNLDFGTGNFCIMGWFKLTLAAPSKVIIERQSATVAGGFILYIGGGLVKFDTSETTYGSEGNLATNNRFDDGLWHYCAVFRQSGINYLYVDGVLQDSAADSLNFTNTSAATTLGIRPDVTLPFSGSLALWRISATAPSPEQIKKIYEDEKVLFQENAQATLYGSSDAVTALAYDDTTELLHVGTSAGRSVFQGLRRVDNTTTSVSAAISASNNLVGEQ